MTMALCLNCGKLKVGALCPCFECNSPPTGDWDMLFSDWHFSYFQLQRLGVIIKKINELTPEPRLRILSFLVYVSRSYPNVLRLRLSPEEIQEAEQVLARLQISAVGLWLRAHWPLLLAGVIVLIVAQLIH